MNCMWRSAAEDPPRGKMGIGVWGLPETHKSDKLKAYIESDKIQEKLFQRASGGRPDAPMTFHLHTQTLYYDLTIGGKKHSLGTGLFVFGKTKDGMEYSYEYLYDIAQSMSYVRLDKKHTVGAIVTDVCVGCECPTGRQGVPSGFLNAVKKTSTVDKSYCEECKPAPVICCICKTEIPGLEDNYLAHNLKYWACQPCSKDRNKQTHWRNHSLEGGAVRDLEGPEQVLHLSDEAIAREKKIRVGENWADEIASWMEVHPDSTPFDHYKIEDLLDPTSEYYWPYQITSREYLQYMEFRRFNNPMQETPSEEWRDVDVTEELLESYYRDLNQVCETYRFRSPKEPGDTPKVQELPHSNTVYRLVDRIHGMTCDTPTCQAVFQHQERIGNCGFASLVATSIPMYTTRPGDLSGTPREAGYGIDCCLMCMDKAVEEACNKVVDAIDLGV